MSEQPIIALRPLAPADVPLLHRWLRNAAVARWWHPAPSYAEVAAKYLPRVAGAAPVHPFIASVAGVPFGYIQWYRLDQNPGHPAEAWAAAGAAALDLLIGEDAYRGRGLGATLLRAFLAQIIFADPGIATCFVDPHPENVAAIRAYLRAGFREAGSGAVGAAGEAVRLLRIERADVRAD